MAARRYRGGGGGALTPTRALVHMVEKSDILWHIGLWAQALTQIGRAQQHRLFLAPGQGGVRCGGWCGAVHVGGTLRALALTAAHRHASPEGSWSPSTQTALGTAAPQAELPLRDWREPSGGALQTSGKKAV